MYIFVCFDFRFTSLIYFLVLMPSLSFSSTTVSSYPRLLKKKKMFTSLFSIFVCHHHLEAQQSERRHKSLFPHPLSFFILLIPFPLSFHRQGRVVTAGGRRWQPDNSTLSVTPVTKEDAGLYTCLASNSEGDGHSNAVLLRVARE